MFALSPSLLKTTLLYGYSLQDCLEYLKSFESIKIKNKCLVHEINNININNWDEFIETTAETELVQKDKYFNETKTLCNLCYCIHASYFVPKSIGCFGCEDFIPPSEEYFVFEKKQFCLKCKDKNKIKQGEVKFNDKVWEIPYVMCTYCNRQYHTTCAMSKPSSSKYDDFICIKCQILYLQTHRYEKLHVSPVWNACEELLPKNTHMATFISNRLNNDTLHVREVLCNARERMVMILQKQDGVFVLLFMMIIKYGSQRVQHGVSTQVIFDPSKFREDEIYISYLDSVQYFIGKERSKMYHTIILAGIDYARLFLRATKCFLWSFTPRKGDDYIISLKPPHQKRLPQKILNEWYIHLFEKGITDGIISKHMDLIDYIIHEDIYSIEQLPYFDGDIWTNWYDPKIGLLKNNIIIFKSLFCERKKLLMCYLAPVQQQQQHQPLECIEYPFTKTRYVFLNGCIVNMFQFDTICKAKYSTQMILYLLNHPNEVFDEFVCNDCLKVITKNKIFYFDDNNQHFCEACYVRLDDEIKQTLKKNI